MIPSLYGNLPERKKIVVSLRFWLMWDLNHIKKGIETKETEIMLTNLKTDYSKDIVDKFFQEAWNGLTATFLRQHQIEPLIINY